MRIGEVAARSGVSTRALRYYEEQHLLSAQRSDSGQRHYTGEVVDRVQLIRRLNAAGLNSKAIAELLPCVQTGVATPAMLERLAAERARVDRQIDDLTRARDRLGEVIDVAVSHSDPPPAPDRPHAADRSDRVHALTVAPISHSETSEPAVRARARALQRRPE